RPDVWRLPRNGVLGSPKQLARNGVKPAQPAAAVVWPLVVLPAQSQIKRQFGVYFEIILNIDVVQVLIQIEIVLADDAAGSGRQAKQKTRHRLAGVRNILRVCCRNIVVTEVAENRI